MKRFSIPICLMVTLAGCGGSQPQIGAPESMPSMPMAAPPIAARPGGAVHFAYVANLSTNNVSAYTINAQSGALTPVKGAPFATNRGPTAVAIDPTGKFAFVTDRFEGVVDGYAIDAGTGALTPVTGSPFKAGNTPVALAIDPTGKFAYVANQRYGPSGDVFAYTIDGSTGALTPVKGSPFGAGSNPTAVAIDPTGKFAYVANGGSGYVSAYTINAGSGALTPVKGPFKASVSQNSIATDPKGKFAYVTTSDGDVFAYTINASTGALTKVKGSPFTADLDADSVAIDPTGKLAYVAIGGASNRVFGYSINASSGALTPVKGSPFKARRGYDATAVAIDPTGKFAYVAKAEGFQGNGQRGNVSAFAISSSSGALTPVKGSPFTADFGSDALAIR